MNNPCPPRPRSWQVCLTLTLNLRPTRAINRLPNTSFWPSASDPRPALKLRLHFWAAGPYHPARCQDLSRIILCSIRRLRHASRL
ncbi:hypothetical protein OH77DRAFT_556702 [Trametes cingulata]|nr:hypothetical protein OH77DRAFT_556702 [Trametes cingulata]